MEPGWDDCDGWSAAVDDCAPQKGQSRKEGSDCLLGSVLAIES